MGIPLSEMKTEQKKILLDLVSEYLHRVPEDVAYTRMNQIEKKERPIFTLPGQGPTSKGRPIITGCMGQAFWSNTTIPRTMRTISTAFGGICSMIGVKIC